MTRFRPRGLRAPIVAAGLLLGCQPVAAAGLVWETLRLAGGRRRIAVHEPAGAASPRAAVVILHGDGGSPEEVRRISGMDAAADRDGFLAVYPEGAGWARLPPRSWNAGYCCGYAAHADVDDVAFLSALLDRLIARWGADPDRLYVTGLSNGGMMAHRLGCALTGRLAAVAVVAGALDRAGCAPRATLPVLMIHGTADGYVPYRGGRGRLVRVPRHDPPVADAAAFWAEANGCAASPTRTREGRVAITRYAACRDQAVVQLVTIEGGGHAWPGGRAGWRFGEPPPQDVSATDLIAAFFQAHRRAGPPAGQNLLE